MLRSPGSLHENVERVLGALPGPFGEAIGRHHGDRPVSAAYQGSSPQSAEVIYKAITVKKPRARYSVVPKPLEAWLLSNLFPTRLIDRIMAKQFGLATTHTNGGRT